MYFLTQTIVVLRWFPPALYVYHNCGIVVSQDIISASSVKVTVSILEIVTFGTCRIRLQIRLLLFSLAMALLRHNCHLHPFRR